jgi:hypothetical protein
MQDLDAMPAESRHFRFERLRYGSKDGDFSHFRQLAPCYGGRLGSPTEQPLTAQ